MCIRDSHLLERGPVSERRVGVDEHEVVSPEVGVEKPAVHVVLGVARVIAAVLMPSLGSATDT